MNRNAASGCIVALALALAACGEGNQAMSPDGEAIAVFDPVFDVTLPPDGGSCPDVYYEETELLDNGVTLTWTSVLAGFDYTLGADYVGTVNWTVDQGSAAFDGFTVRNNSRKTWTPTGSSGADVFGTMTPGAPGDGTVDVTVSMDPMHATADGQLGNGHFWLLLTVDDGAGNEEQVKLGVNFHLEDPDGAETNCPA
ncbi:MAG: hypothetical protein OEM96_05105 [Gemmatimonadota bacterium]|nr:hypothetical protein [Gemmatimonadota bacterium]